MTAPAAAPSPPSPAPAWSDRSIRFGVSWCARTRDSRSLGGPAIPSVPGAVWENPAFVDLLADAMLTKAASERRHNALATGASDGALRPLVKSSTEVGRALGQLMMSTTHEETMALAQARQALVGLGDLALGCPAGTCDNQRFLGWLGQIVERVRNIPRGRCLLLPGGWYENRWSSDGLRGSSQG